MFAEPGRPADLRPRRTAVAGGARRRVHVGLDLVQLPDQPLQLEQRDQRATWACHCGKDSGHMWNDIDRQAKRLEANAA